MSLFNSALNHTIWQDQLEKLNQQKFSKIILLEMEAEANAQSAYSSTSIEGNPLPLTDVKKILKNRPDLILMKSLFWEFIIG